MSETYPVSANRCGMQKPPVSEITNIKINTFFIIFHVSIVFLISIPIPDLFYNKKTLAKRW
jgi:hypothetical protein